MNKFERQGTILRLVQERPLATQAEVADALREAGIEAVQTTVSRDIAQLGLVKVRAADGRLVYALPGAADLDRLVRADDGAPALDDLDDGRERARRPPHACAATRLRSRTRSTRAGLADVAGTVAGENTIFVAPREGVTGSELEEMLRHHLEGDT